jgi:hypothetical protein
MCKDEFIYLSHFESNFKKHMKNSLLLRNSIVAASVVFATYTAYTFSSQAPPNANGSPGSNGNTCASATCHSGPAVSDQTITITSDIPSAGFSANTDYTITVTADRGTSSASTSGFEVSVENAGGNDQGTLSTGGNSNVRLVGMGSFVSHNGKQSFTGGQSVWTFNWNSGNAEDGSTIYAVVNFANNNGSTNGDVIQTKSMTLMKAPNISVEENDIASFSLYPNPTTEFVNVELGSNINGNANLEIYNLKGQLVMSENLNQKINTIEVSNLNKGLYILNIQSEQGKSSEKLIIQ